MIKHYRIVIIATALGWALVILATAQILGDSAMRVTSVLSGVGIACILLVSGILRAKMRM